MDSLLQAVKMKKAARSSSNTTRGGLLGTSSTSGCSARDKDVAVRSLLQEKAISMGVPCENMCKELGAYPNCQCPGFEGQPASSDDTRGCMTQYCQDPSSPCPNDAFVGCVKENTKVSVLQWDAVFQKVSTRMDSLLQAVRMGKAARGSSNATRGGLLARQSNCGTRDSAVAVRALLQEKSISMGVP